MTSDHLWAITSYFNPAGYKSRLSNFRAFREKLKVPLVAVELSYGPDFELRPGDAEILVQLRGRDVLWQKERLLNVALQRLPRECDKVAWIDCDIVFNSPHWPDDAGALLERYSLIQLFTELYDIPHRVPLGEFDPDAVEATAHSFAHKMGNRTATSLDLRPPSSGRLRQCSFGAAWASRRDVLDEHGFYDFLVIGSGDRAMACAAYGKFEDAIDTACLSKSRAEHYLAWARPFFETVRGRVGCVEGRIFHLWHGYARDRRYLQRHREFRRLDFDPHDDIAIDEHGCWKWNTDKPELHRFLSRYFLQRNEDESS